MLVINPKNNVLDFEAIDWLLENVPSPKKDVQAFLRAKFKELNNKDDNESYRKDWLSDASYGHFYLAENGSILLIDDDSEGGLLLVGADADALRLKLAAKAASIAKKLEALLGK